MNLARNLLCTCVYSVCLTAIAGRAQTADTPPAPPPATEPAAAVAPAVVPAAVATEAPPPVPVLVELFTSEGCSSCPAGDDLVAALNGTVTPQNRQIVTLSEHVTYWNKLGWVDPYSQDLFSDRQNTYGENFGMDEIYTPMVVVNGQKAAVGSDRNALLSAVQTLGKPMPLTITVYSAVLNGGTLSVNFIVDGALVAENAEVYAALTDDRDIVQVPHGENAGSTLTHVAVVRSLSRVPMLKAGQQTLAAIPVPVELADPAPGAPPPLIVPRHLVLFAQVAGQGRIVGIATRPLSVAFPTPRRGAAAQRVVH